MGNQTIHQYKYKEITKKNSYRNSFHQRRNVSRYEQEPNRIQFEFKQQQHHSLDMTPNRNFINFESDQRNYHLEVDRILERLNRKNEQLRKQLREISQKLSLKLEKRKILVKKKYDSSEADIDPSANKGIKRQLQNAYKQIDMYKRQIADLKSKEEGHKAYLKIDKIQNDIAIKDKQIKKLLDKIISFKNVKKGQDKVLFQDLNDDQYTTIESYKTESENLKNKLKQISKRDRLREETYKKQQSYLYQVEKKLRLLNGEYYPQLKKEQKMQPKSPRRKIIYSAIELQPSSPIKRKLSIQSIQNSIEQLQPIRTSNPSLTQIIDLKQQLDEIKKKHEEYHRKIDSLLVLKNKQIDQYMSVNEAVQNKKRIIENLKIKIESLKKIGKLNKKNMFGHDLSSILSKNLNQSTEQQQYYQQQKIEPDIFQIGHLISNLPKPAINSPLRKNKFQSQSKTLQVVVQESKGNAKVWSMGKPRIQSKGLSVKGEFKFDDKNVFEEGDYPKIIGFNLWLNQQNDILGIQAIYLLEQQIIQGYKSANPSGNIAHYDLKKPDYIKKIGGSIGNNGIVEYLVFTSKEGKIGRFGNLKQDQKKFNFEVSQHQRPCRISGASMLIGIETRLCKFNVQICKDR